jgi:class 3 adenylate cyclase
MSIKKIIIVILLLMFIIPLFSIDVYRDPENAWDYHLHSQYELLLLPPASMPTAYIVALTNSTITSYFSEQNHIIQYSTPFNELPHYSSIDLSRLRSSDLISSVQIINDTEILANRPDLSLKTTLTAKETNALTVILDQSQLNAIVAAFSLAKTLFICLVLILLLQLFAKDINTLLVEPIEGMMEKLMLMAKDPESAAKEELNANTELETTVISNAIIKIGALLSIVFGSAGAEIIGSNIIQEGDMNPMIEGKKKCAIFGFCDIRHFTEVTEVLQEEILIFVNKIGSLVHESVYRYGGCANKNIGEAFLLVWKIPEEKYALDYQTNAIEWKDRRYLSVLSDFAVMGFVKTLIKIHKDPLVLEYSMDSRLKASMPDFSVSMGFGLHVGWAIEGAIGSEYKIDASYLSPNVNMASRLEAATKQFGVDFLISEDLYELLTTDMKSFFRNIDRVTVKGSEKPIRLYTIDLNYDRITPPARKDLKYPDAADMPDSENKRAINMEYLRDDEIDQYNAKVLLPSCRNSSWARRN